MFCSRMALTSGMIVVDSVYKMLSKTVTALLTRFDIVCSILHSGAMLIA